jgi:prepilin-type N-terminal cleavage/methylation domain-containing protein
MSRIFDLYLAFIFGDIPNAVSDPEPSDEIVKRKSRDGFSLVELVIVLSIVCILGLLCASVLGRGCIGNSQSVDAVEQATAYANFMYPGKNPRIQCVRLDSDNDGYVSCTIAYDAENAVTGMTLTETVAVECAAGWTSNDGCRVANARVNAQ